MNDRLNMQDIAGILAEKTGKSKTETEQFLRTFISVVTTNVLTDKLVKVKGLGTFKIVLVEQRESVHVNTKERILIPAHYKFSFLPDKELKELVNEPFSFFETTELIEGVEFDDEATENSTSEVVAEHTQNKEVQVAKQEPTTVIEEEIKEPMKLERTEEKPVISFKNEEQKKETSKFRKISWKYILLGIVSSVLIIALGFWGTKILVSTIESSEQFDPISLSDQEEKETIQENSEEATVQLCDSLNVTDDTERIEEIGQEEDVISPQSSVLAKKVIRPGDRLTLISLEYYNSKIFWVYIYDFNKDKITDPNNVPIGTEIEVPIPELYGIDAKDRSAVEKAAALQTQILSEK